MATASARATARAYLSDSYIFQWDKRSFRADLIFVIPVALCLAIGFAAGHPGAAVISAGGAMTVGFGAKQSIDKSRLLPMIFATFGIAFSVFLGMVAGHRNFTLIPLAMLWGFIYGIYSRREGGYGWVVQQCVITLLVGSAFPFEPRAAAVRGCLMMAGGVVQVLCSSLLLRIFSELRQNLTSLGSYVFAEQIALRDVMAETVTDLRQHRFADSVLPYAIRLAITLGISTEIYRRLHFASGYWIPMTALVVMKPGFADTVSRAVARTLGTIAGAWITSIFIAHFVPSPLVLAIFTVVFAWTSYATLNVNYALFASSLTGYIVFLLSMTKIPEMEIAHRRVLCTAIGGALALSIRLVVIFRKRKQIQDALVKASNRVELQARS